MKITLAYHVTLSKQPGEDLSLWLPLPASTDYQETIALRHEGNYRQAGVFTEPVYDARAFHARWDASRENPHLGVTLEVRTRERRVAVGRVEEAGAVPPPLKVFLAPTAHIPTDGIVKRRAEEITRGKATTIEKVRAIYGWIIENTHRDFQVAWCGVGDVRAMLEGGNLCGKCVDINSLLVALVRAAGIPAREVFGIRAAPSRLAPTLGRAGDISGAQHCKSEVYLAGLGWLPVDPADVVKLTDEKQPAEVIARAREYLFGGSEDNWVAFNHARDFLPDPPPARGPVNYFMYPHAESAGKPMELKAGNPGYTISSVVSDEK